jgi:hypothetical protein
MPRAGVTHDITIEDAGGTNRLGFMLVRQGGKRGWNSQDSQTISPRILSMGEVTHSELPPELELIWFQEDWSLGIGGINDRLDPKRLAFTNKIDASVPGVLKPAREATLTAIKSGDTPNNYRPTGFGVIPMITAAATINYDLWLFLGRDVYQWDPSDDEWDIKTEPLAADVQYRNAVIFGTTAVAPSWYVGTDIVDSAAQYMYKAATDANWTSSTITAGRFKYMTVGRNSTGNEILWGANTIFKTARTVNEALDNSETDVTLDAAASGHVAVNDIILVDTLGDQETMLVTGISTAVLTVVRGYGSSAVAHDSGAIVSLYQPHVIKSSSDPSNAGSWSTAVEIGTDDSPITGIVVDGDTDTILVTKTNGIYSYTTDGQVRNLTTLFRQFGHTDNFRAAYVWNGHILLPLGGGGLLDFNYANATIKDISLSISTPEQTALHGQVVAMHGDPTHLFALVRDSDSSEGYYYVMQANEVEHEGMVAFRWHVLAKLGADGTLYPSRVSLMVDTSRSDRRRLWIGYEESSVSSMPYYIAFGDTGDDEDDGYTNDTDAYADTVQWDANLPRVSKRYESIELETRNLGAGGRQINVQYKLDNADAWTTLDAVTESPLQTLNFPLGTTGKSLELRLTPALTAVGTTPAELRSFRLKAQLRPDATKLYPLTVYLAGRQQALNGAIGGNPRADLKQLRTWDAAPADLVFGTPDEQDPKSVIFMPGSLKEQEAHNDKTRAAEYYIQFTLAEV